MNRFLILSALTLASATVHAASPYISQVYEYRPAPGQYVGELPEAEESETVASMLDKARQALVGDAQPGAVSLGAFGGYVIFGFDHTILNVAGAPDFKVYGNALISDPSYPGGSCEPGIVWVSRDENSNGLPDDTWYELAGSAETEGGVRRNFSVTYHKPASSHTPTPHPLNKHILDTTYIAWSASDGTSGFLSANDFHLQSYWPAWEEGESVTFTGTCLPPNAIDTSGDGSYFVLKMLDWGYVDNRPNTQLEGFDISHAIDASGSAVHLDGIDFVKVATGMHQQCGQLGETSTEVCGAEDLHPEASVASIKAHGITAQKRPGGVSLRNDSSASQSIRIISSQGLASACIRLLPGEMQFMPLAGGNTYIIVSTAGAIAKIAL